MNQNLAYQEEWREELIDGTIVAMSPCPSWNHVSIAGKLYTIFSNYLRGKPCTPIPGGFDLHLTNRDTFVPDMRVVCDRDKRQQNGVYGSPDLVVEVLSPSTAKRDKGYKKDAYEAAGVPEYWLVNPADRSIEVYLLAENRYILDNVYSIYPDWMLEAMTQEETAEIVTEFKCHLYDDLLISLEDIFSGLLDV